MSKTVSDIYWHEKCGQRCSLTLSVDHQTNKLSHNYLLQDSRTLLSFLCMPYLECCLPVCLKRQTFDHPFTEDPDREDNFIEVDNRPPFVIYLCDLYSLIVVSWSDYWEGE